MTIAPASARARTAIPTLALWTWMIPSAYFWHRAGAGGVMLPQVPSVVWMPAGTLWEYAPLGFLVVLALLSVAMHALSARASAYRVLRPAALLVGVVSALVHLVWGSAMLRAA